MKIAIIGTGISGQNLLPLFPGELSLSNRWTWPGTHYEKTSNAWISRKDSSREAVLPVLEKTYGRREARRWFYRWRMFFMAGAELFGFRNGEQWQVSHYLMESTG